MHRLGVARGAEQQLSSTILNLPCKLLGHVRRVGRRRQPSERCSSHEGNDELGAVVQMHREDVALPEAERVQRVRAAVNASLEFAIPQSLARRSIDDRGLGGHRFVPPFAVLDEEIEHASFRDVHRLAAARDHCRRGRAQRSRRQQGCEPRPPLQQASQHVRAYVVFWGARK